MDSLYSASRWIFLFAPSSKILGCMAMNFLVFLLLTPVYSPPDPPFRSLPQPLDVGP
jgi:hypothetical protein